MTKTITPDNALYRSAALCSRSEQSEYDIRKKLSSWGIDDTDADKIISRLVEGNYLNETRYAHAFVRDKFRFSGWGRNKISFALRQKHITTECIDDALTEIAESEYTKALHSALKSKLRTIADKEPFKQRASLFRFAASRGFEPSIISSAISAILKDNNSDEHIDEEDYF